MAETVPLVERLREWMDAGGTFEESSDLLSEVSRLEEERDRMWRAIVKMAPAAGPAIGWLLGLIAGLAL